MQLLSWHLWLDVLWSSLWSSSRRFGVWLLILAFLPSSSSSLVHFALISVIWSCNSFHGYSFSLHASSFMRFASSFSFQSCHFSLTSSQLFGWEPKSGVFLPIIRVFGSVSCCKSLSNMIVMNSAFALSLHGTSAICLSSFITIILSLHPFLIIIIITSIPSSSSSSTPSSSPLFIFSCPCLLGIFHTAKL